MTGDLIMAGNLIRGLPTTYQPLFFGNKAILWGKAIELEVDIKSKIARSRTRERVPRKWNSISVEYSKDDRVSMVSWICDVAWFAFPASWRIRSLEESLTSSCRWSRTDAKPRKALRTVTPIYERILVAEFDSNPVTTVIVIYSPTNVAPVEEAEAFYEKVGEIIRDVPAHNFLAVLGDFNARLGPEGALYTYHGETNHNGKLLVDLLTEHDLLAANTQFRKKRGKRWTFLDRCTRAKRQLDYILVRKKWRNSVLNAEPYHTFCTVGSDHRVVSMRVRPSLRVPKPIHKVRYDWKLFSASDELQKQYTVEVKNRFEVLEIEDANERYQRFVEANRQAMESCVPEKEKKKCKSFLRHPEIVRAREMVETASKSVNATSDFKATQNLKEAKTLLYNTYDQLKEQEIKEKIHRVENLPDDSRYGEAWVVINEITGRKKTIEGQVAGASSEERVKTWYNHFQNLLGSTSETEELEDVDMILAEGNISDDPFSPEEYIKVKISLKQGKSSGPDEIPPEVLKNCDLDNIILDIYRYKGCYIDRPNRALTLRVYKDSSENGVNSNGRCIRDCANRGFTFAGTSASNECHCGNNYDYDKHDPRENECYTRCRNNPSETCGGDWRLQIYSGRSQCPYHYTSSLRWLLQFVQRESTKEQEMQRLTTDPTVKTNVTAMLCRVCTPTADAGMDVPQDCSVNNGGCQHDCNEQYIDVWCSCRDGYKVSTEDWKKCVDVNECKGVKGEDYHEDCHTCLNTAGSYTCNCTGGYKVDPSTKQKCIDINECEGKRGVDYHQDCHNCTNTIGSYTCGCRGGYELDYETQKKCIGEILANV
ncbi:hypothetical protein CAPTEDRAFT_209188 [Capitella teleta]|uniref:WSC domain-containing protein n=1 Tax=Capitella teleta TaxID=283909 RepID=R7VIG7_CAPTE|nr:hypothetical protein CAPTEDRAFT_209188 [Capitella teleta]|eukprot:ELU18633.1 hypothetical protein CAPTEDRAFT_209188 [Capitella teleta]